MVVLGLGLTVAVGFAPVTTWAGFQYPAKQTCRFNAQSQDSNSHLMRVSVGERIIMARGGNQSGGGGGGGGMGRRGADNSERGSKYGPRDGTGYGTKKGAGTGDCDGTGPKGKGRGNRTN